MRNEPGCSAYVLAVFAASGVLHLLISVTGGIEGRHFGLIAQTLMWVPGLLALLFLKLGKQSLLSPGWKLRGWRYSACALLVPPLIDLAAMSLLVASGAAKLPEQIVHVQDQVAQVQQGVRLVLGAGPQGIPFFLINFSLSVLVMSILVSPLNAVFALGEELGWRGYLQPRLAERLGPRAGILATGLIWGYWHFPVIWMGYNFPEYPKLGALLLMPLLCLGMAGFLGWLYARTESIWVPTLAHATGNASGGVLLTLQPGRCGPLWIYASAVAAWAVVGIACLVLVRDDRPAQPPA